MNKVVNGADEAIRDIIDGMTFDARRLRFMRITRKLYCRARAKRSEGFNLYIEQRRRG